MSEGFFSWMNDFFAWMFSLGMDGKLTWVTRHWPKLVLVIAIFVVVMDLLVWFIRYRPYRKWKRMWDSVLSRLRTTRPAQVTPTEPERARRPRSRYDLPTAPLAAQGSKAHDTRVLSPVRSRERDDIPTMPVSRAPAGVIDVPTLARRAPLPDNVTPIPKREDAAPMSELENAPDDAQDFMVSDIPPLPPPSETPSRTDDDTPTLR